MMLLTKLFSNSNYGINLFNNDDKFAPNKIHIMSQTTVENWCKKDALKMLAQKFTDVKIGNYELINRIFHYSF